MTQKIEQKADSTVCYCHRLTTSDLMRSYEKCGSLSRLQEETKAGTGCGGCRIILQSMFGELPVEINDLSSGIPGATVCLKPGSRVMRGFIVSDERLESTIYSCNAVPPQFSDCDSTMPIEYAALNHDGKPVLHRMERIKTNETFVFDTRKENLPRPFYGTFIYALGRSNYGASRFNVYWSNGRSTASTHEISVSGRADVVLPIVATTDFVNGPNTVYLAIQNPHGIQINYSIRVFDVESGDEIVWNSGVPPSGVKWFNMNQQFYRPVLEKCPRGKFAARISAPGCDSRLCPTMYFFTHNTNTNLWNCSHL